MDQGMCRAGCGFFGSEKFDSFCSQCFKLHCKVDHQSQQQPETLQKPSEAPSPPLPEPSVEEKALPKEAAVESPAPQPKKRNRCRECSKRVGLTGFSCRCGGLFCAEHRYDKEHNCDFDFKSLERGWIREKNPVVQAEKIQRI